MSPVDLQRVDGVRVSLRLVVPQDAAYIHDLRLDPQYNMHLSRVTGSVADQKAWITRYKTRQAQGQEYYYVIERRADAIPCGLVRLYDIAGERFTWGSWILDQNKPPKAALESAVLSFGVAFTHLGLATGEIDVRNDNANARAFYDRFGMTFLRRDAQDTFYEYTNARYEKDVGDHLKAIATASET